MNKKGKKLLKEFSYMSIFIALFITMNEKVRRFLGDIEKVLFYRLMNESTMGSINSIEK